MAFSSINEITNKSEFPPTKKLKDLEPNGFYEVSNIRSVKTKYGPRFTAEIQGEFTVFLPPRVVNAFEKDPVIFGKLMEAAHTRQLSMKYIGGKWNGVEFHETST